MMVVYKAQTALLIESNANVGTARIELLNGKTLTVPLMDLTDADLNSWIIEDSTDLKLGMSQRCVGNPDGACIMLWTGLEDKYTWVAMEHDSYDAQPYRLMGGMGYDTMREAQQAADEFIRRYMKA
jgi:hypothetical protein